MNSGRVARRYARALLDIAIARNDVDGWSRDLRRVETFLGEPSVAALLESPSLPFARKREIVDGGLAGLDDLRRSFAYVLVANGRVRQIVAIGGEFDRLVNEHRGIAIAEVSTAVPLDEATAREVVRRLEALTSKRIIVNARVDPGILGGVVARIGDRLIDGSVAGQLAALREELTR